MESAVDASKLTKSEMPVSRGRKPRGASRLGKPISFRVPPEVEEQFRAKAEASGMSQADFLRECVLNNRTKVIARPAQSGDRKLLLYAINKIGNNLNQLAHAANAANLTGRVSEPTYRAILDHLQWVERYLTGILGRVD